MEGTRLRIGIVGASSLLGKELAEELGSSVLAAAEVALLDEEEAAGQLTSLGDEASFIRSVEPSAFSGLDLVFFAGTADQARKYGPEAVKAGIAVIDLTTALRGEAGAIVRSPWIAEAQGAGSLMNLGTSVVIPAHPVVVMLGLVGARCTRLGVNLMAATVLVPASERGQAGMDEMHQQTVNLLSFQSLPQEEFDAQVAFNLLPSLGIAAKVGMDETAARIEGEYRAAGRLPELTLQLVQAPVFHGYAASVMLEAGARMPASEIVAALAGEHIDLPEEDEVPSNVSAAGQGDVMVRVKSGASRRMWLWLATDNLKLTALHAIACAVELVSLRPKGIVQ
ncbi:aspartate-semialdehyde dehydrogenase [Granulicella pectinivorans]|uniref:Aspartate-semialdehyde dehydrogenase n=1 Tax=Granulicella pectinivorans TaxID=474950 RepID=A0A1I6MQY6_9BACT|nr:aspartate-semialdehyde dehydrogenase [Granulicella pectinivorans]